VNVDYRPGSKYLWYDFTVRGHRYRGSTRETNQTRAEAIAAIRLKEAMDETDPLSLKATKLRDFSERFLTWVEQSTLDDDTKTYYQNGWRMLASTKLAGMRLNMINNDEAVAVRFPGRAANRNRAIRTLSRMLHKAEGWKLIRQAPKLKRAQEQERSLRLDEATEQKLLDGAACCNWRGSRCLALFTDVILLMRDTGMRDQRELYQVRIENLDFERKLIFVPDSKTPAGRRGIPMSERVFNLLNRLCEGKTEGWLFPSKRSKSGHLTTLAKHFREACRAAGLPDELVLYCGRHDFGSRIYAKTGNLKAVMAVMGHKDVKTAMKYQHPDLEIVRQALDDGGSKATGA
jgi:integrase